MAWCRRTWMLVVIAWLGVNSAAPAGDDVKAYAEALRARARVLKQYPGDLRWQEIPWARDLADGMAAARKEKRPIFLWTSGDEPLGRC